MGDGSDGADDGASDVVGIIGEGVSGEGGASIVEDGGREEGEEGAVAGCAGAAIW